MKKIVGFIVLLTLTMQAMAQDYQGYYYGTFDFNQPLSNTQWNNATSVFGIKAGYQHMLSDRFSVGGDLNWGSYKQYKPTETTVTPGGAITSDYFHYVYAYGLTVSGAYYLPVDGKLVRPYAGVGLGAAYNKYTTFYNIYTDQTASWGFLVRPEAGIMLRFNENRSFGLTAGVHYDISTAQQKAIGYSNFSNVGINIGIIIIDW